MNIFVAKLSFNTDDDGLREAFETYGSVVSAKVIFDNYTGKSKGFGFVEMSDQQEAVAAIDGLNESELDGRTIVVKKAEERGGQERRSNGFSRERRY